MSFQNSWKFTKTVIDIDKFLEATGNRFQFVSQKPFQSKKHPEDSGSSVTLLIIHDSMDYGIDKNGRKRDTNLFQTIDVTILNGKSELPFRKGEKVSLVGFIPEKSYAINFDLLLRFKDIKKAGE